MNSEQITLSTDKTNVKEFQLIDGEFTPENAKSVLGSLIRHKINYHNELIFSMGERFGIEPPHSRQRIEELTKTREQIDQFITEAKKHNMNFQINSKIEITLVD